MAYRMDFFAGIESKVLAAIKSEKVKYPAYVFVRDEEASNTGRLAFVDQNNVLKFIRGENKQHVLHVDILPENGDVEVLYIMDGIVYVFDGEDYNPMYKDHTADIEELKERVDSLEAADIEIAEKVTDLETEANAISEQIAEIEDKLEVLEAKCGADCEYLYEKVKYEITGTPIGTLVDYREKEIRVMCPEGTVFTKQNVGSTGNANMYYMGFKAYAPEGAVSFKEDDLATIEDQTMYYFEDNDFAGTDKFGRKYSIVWLALASYNESSDTWTYFGKNSTTDHYIGWYYSVEWYNADGIMIASDKIRINLSNENCHSAIEPFYIGELSAEVEALKDANEKLVEQVQTVTEQMTEIEERVIEIEKETFTFIELE